MKDIKNFDAPKYGGEGYSSVEEGIYKAEDNGETVYVTSFRSPNSARARTPRKYRSIP